MSPLDIQTFLKVKAALEKQIADNERQIDHYKKAIDELNQRDGNEKGSEAFIAGMMRTKMSGGCSDPRKAYILATGKEPSHKALIEWRRRNGILQEQLAAMCGLSRQTISAIENDNITVDISTMMIVEICAGIPDELREV